MNLSDYNLIFASQRCLIGISRISSAGTNPRNTSTKKLSAKKQVLDGELFSCIGSLETRRFSL